MSASLEPTELPAGRLLLRPWRAEDAAAVLAACQDPAIAAWTSVPQPYTAEDARTWVEDLAPAEWASGRGTPFAVVDAADGRLLASISLMGIGERGAEVGFWCVAQERGRGVVGEALDALCRWGFASLGLPRITWFAYVGNDASRRVAERTGFVVEGTLRSYLVQRGTRRDAWIGGLLPGDLRVR